LPEIETRLEKLGLAAQQISQSFDQVSGGEKQRMVVAICLALNKPIILLDEPTSSLD
jgi:polar amino acid transport system ATP-binding protein/putative ABC transport system ATP-binding protein